MLRIAGRRRGGGDRLVHRRASRRSQSVPSASSFRNSTAMIRFLGLFREILRGCCVAVFLYCLAASLLCSTRNVPDGCLAFTAAALVSLQPGARRARGGRHNGRRGEGARPGDMAERLGARCSALLCATLQPALRLLAKVSVALWRVLLELTFSWTCLLC